MVAFAGNSLLCRAALKDTQIDAATFTTIRIVAGAVVLWVIVRIRDRSPGTAGTWLSGFWLFAYAAGFSFAYITLTAATGALLLFGAVQATMIGYGLWKGERLAAMQWFGLVVALAGLAVMLLPGASAPSATGAALMIFAGISWGFYSLRGRGAGDPTRVTADQMEEWCGDFDNWAICDTACFKLFDRSPLAWKKIRPWSRRRAEFEKRAAFALMASLAVHDKKAPDDKIAALLPLLEGHSDDDRNFVKKAVNWALRQIGKRNLGLHTLAVESAQRIKHQKTKAARWIAADALRELKSEATIERLKRKHRG
jgi:hypothetical protein